MTHLEPEREGNPMKDEGNCGWPQIIENHTLRYANVTLRLGRAIL